PPPTPADPLVARTRYLRKPETHPMTDPDNIANRATGPVLDPDERPASNAKRWAILLGFAAAVFIAAASINHRDAPGAGPPGALSRDSARARQHQCRVAARRAGGEVGRVATRPR